MATTRNEQRIQKCIAEGNDEQVVRLIDAFLDLNADQIEERVDVQLRLEQRLLVLGQSQEEGIVDEVEELLDHQSEQRMTLQSLPDEQKDCFVSDCSMKGSNPCAPVFHQAQSPQEKGNSDEEREYGNARGKGNKTLRQALERLAKQLETYADTLGKKSCTKKDSIHWHMRGRQEVVREVADHLQGLCTKYCTFYALYLALQDYLGCLEKYEVDVEEEKNAPPFDTESSVQRWKATGARQELPEVFGDIHYLLSLYAPQRVHHILSFDGSRLIPLERSDADTQQQEKEHLSVPMRSVHADDRMNMRKPINRSLPSENNHARGLVLPVPDIGSLHQALNALVPSNQMISSRLLGPFPPCPEELHGHQQVLLEKLERDVSEQRCVLVKTAGDTYDDVELLWTCVDRLLQYTPIERILVLAGTATLKHWLCRTYEEWVFLEDGDRLVRPAPGQYALTVPLAPTTRVCIASIRESQLLVPVHPGEDEPQIEQVRPVLVRDTFDVIIIYGTPVLSSLWQRVIPYFTVSHLICFSSAPAEPLATRFDTYGDKSTDCDASSSGPKSSDRQTN